ncbi:hypothetical protein R5W24_005598 [Gemmata sp. JC717]|uniref:hypothetical protein n=1 Tax=Gemmata algarum TaxID=2975278 RepID=UPI0021BAF8A1|nr:hypothetical protein [Gemmata algarum]MDY3556432.1 hypothetical protein [Gemmata algarum]
MRTLALLSAYAGALALGTYQTFYPTFDTGFANVQTERGDGMLNHLILENSWLALSDPGYRGTLATAPFFFPERYTIAYSENLFGSAPIYWGLRLVVGYELAYAWWQIVCTVLNFIAFAVVCRWLRMPHAVALTGAFVGAFAVVYADQIKHAQMIPRFYSPFVVYYAIVLVTEVEGKAKALNRMLGALFLQCLACVYTGWFLATGLAVFFPLLVALRPGSVGELRAFAVANKRRVGGILLLWAGAMLALFVPYILVNYGVTRTYEECYNLFPTPSAWFTGPKDSRWSETLAQVRDPAPYECLLFSGFALYGLILAACVHLPLLGRDRRGPLWPAAVAALATAALWVLFTMPASQTGESLWRVVRLIPGGNAIRVVSRVYVTVYLFGTMGMLLWLSSVLERPGLGWVRIALVPVLALLVWEQTGYHQESFSRKDFYPFVDQHAETLRGGDAGYVIPRFVDGEGLVSTGAYGEVFSMWVGLRANVPVVNGYSGRWPNDFPQPEGGALSDGELQVWLAGRYKGKVRRVDSEFPGVSTEVVIE